LICGTIERGAEIIARASHQQQRVNALDIAAATCTASTPLTISISLRAAIEPNRNLTATKFRRAWSYAAG
jgi:hypothetical protein